MINKNTEGIALRNENGIWKTKNKNSVDMKKTNMSK